MKWTNNLGMININRLRFAAILNRSSGGCDTEAEAILAGILQRAGLETSAIECVDGVAVAAALDRIIKSRPDVLIVLGGDGTIRSAAEKCGAADITLIPLPGGTMNMLPRALYNERDWQSALKDTLANPLVTSVSGGEVEGHRFFCAGIFGAPALWSDAREEIRSSRIFSAYKHALMAFHRTFSQKVSYQFDRINNGASTAVVVICPLISSAFRSDVTAVEAAALDLHGARDAFRLGWNAAFANWRLDASVKRAAAQLIKVSSKGRMPALLDGEAVSLNRSVEIRFVPDCFRAIVPVVS